jgi:hypothetical protein
MNLLFNEELYLKRRGRAAGNENFSTHPFLTFVADSLCERVQAFARNFDRIAIFAEATAGVENHCRTANPAALINNFFLPLPFSGNIFPDDTLYQLIILGPFLQSCNDVRGLLINCLKYLDSDGIVIGCLWGDETLSPLRQILVEAEMERGTTPRVHPMITVKTLGQICSEAGFTRVVTDIERIYGAYDNALALFHDLHILGESSVLLARHPGLVTKNWLSRIDERFSAHASEREIRMPFDLVSFFGTR